MKKIYNNLNIENLMKTKWFTQFDGKQQIEIKSGIESKVDVFRYAKKEFEALQMSTCAVDKKVDKSRKK